MPDFVSPSLSAPLHVSANGRYLEDSSGQPFFWLGDTAWPLFGQYTREDALRYLANRAEKGFTVIQGVLGWGGGTGFETRMPGPNYAGDSPWLSDPSQPNEVYFQHVDFLLEQAAQLGLVLAVLPTWGYYVNDVKVFNPLNARQYGLWLGRRYKKVPNLVWVNGGDRIPTGSEEVYRALALGLREGDGGAHLITYHPCGWRSSAQFFANEAWLDIHMIETWTEWFKVYQAVLSDSLLTPIKPVVLGEGAYEDGPEYPLGPITPLICRRQTWWTFCAGGYFTYGQNQNWRYEATWKDSLDTPGAVQMGIFRQIATSRPWWQRVADQGVINSSESSERTLNTAVRGEDSTWAMIYCASACNIQVNLDKILTRYVKAAWVNPATGEKVEEGRFETGNLIEGRVFPRRAAHWFATPPRWEDAVLILDGEKD
jgi:hypothetical protein